jgi:hypothetical protein
MGLSSSKCDTPALQDTQNPVRRIYNTTSPLYVPFAFNTAVLFVVGVSFIYNYIERPSLKLYPDPSASSASSTNSKLPTQQFVRTRGLTS